MSNDDLDFELDDDDDIGFDDDDQFEDDDDEGVDDEPAAEADDVAPAKAAPEKPYDPDAKVPFFKNWAWWCSLIAAVPAITLLVALLVAAANHAGQFNWMMWVVVIPTFFCAFAASVLPILMALGFFLGGKEVTVTDSPQAATQAESSGDDSGMGDVDGFADDDDDELYDDDDDDDDFDAFDDDEF